MENKYQASKDYIYRNIAGSDVLISVGANIADFNGYIELNSSALVLWKKLQAPCRLPDLVQTLKETYSLSTEQATADAIEFLNVLIEHHMVLVLDHE